MSVMNIIATAEDRVSGVLKGIADTGSRSAGSLIASWKGAATSIAGLAASLEAVVRRGQETEIAIGRLANTTSMTTQEVRDLTVSLIDATRPLEDVNNLLSIGRQMGLRSSEQLRQFADFWDMVGDATGETSYQLAQASGVMRSLGVSVENPTEALGALGFIAGETTTNISDFLTFIERSIPNMREYGFSINDVAAIMGTLEHEVGMTGRTARMEFRAALNAADGDLRTFFDTLGITVDEFRDYRDQVHQSFGYIPQQAQLLEESRTTIQRLSSDISKLTVQYGDLLHAVEILSPILMGFSTAIISLAAAKYVLGGVVAWLVKSSFIPLIKAAWGVGAALIAGISWPVWVVIGVIAALGAAVYLLIDQWDNIGPFFANLWQGVLDIFHGAWNWIYNSVQETSGLVIAAWELLPDSITNILSRVKEAFNDLWNGVKNGSSGAFNFIVQQWNALPEFIRGPFESVYGIIVDFWGAVADTVRGFFSWLWDVLSGFAGGFFNWLADIGERIDHWAHVLSFGLIGRSNEARIGMQNNFQATSDHLRAAMESAAESAKKDLKDLGASGGAVAEDLTNAWNSVGNAVNRVAPIARAAGISIPAMMGMPSFGMPGMGGMGGMGGFGGPPIMGPQGGPVGISATSLIPIPGGTVEEPMAAPGGAVSPAAQVRGDGININFQGLFSGANVQINSKADAKAISEELWILFRNRLRAEGVKL